jgi:assimilatory nitrate reductase catalytic subunit
VLHELIRNDWLDHEFIDAHTVGFDEAAAAVAEMTPAWAAGITGVPAARIEQAADWWGTSATGMLLHARGIEQHTKGVDNVVSAINLGLATGKFGKPGCGVSTITGQGNGQGGREHGHKCDQLPGNRDISNPEHRAYIASVWGCDEAEIPGKGIPAQEIIEAIHAGEIKGLLSICFNPSVSAPDANFTAEAFDKLEFYAVIDFFLSETAHHADVVLPGSLHEEDEGTSTSGEGRIIKINAAVTPPGEARRDWEILLDIARRLDRGQYFPYTSTEEIFEELRVASAGGTADYAGATWQRIEDEMGLFWPIPEVGHPGTPRLYEGGRFYHPDGKARFHGVPFKESAEVVDDEYPVWLTTGRVVSQYLSGTQTRRIGGLVEQYPEPLCEMHPRLAEQLGVADGELVTVTSRRGEITLPANVVTTIRPDTVFIPYHWPGKQAANQLTNRAVDPVSKMPEFKVAAVRVARA